MRIENNYSLEKYNTFHLPAKTRWFMEYESEDDLQKILRDEYFKSVSPSISAKEVICFSLMISMESSFIQL